MDVVVRIIDWGYYTATCVAMGEILRLQRHYKIGEISVHYHNKKGVGRSWRGVLHPYKLKSNDLETIDIIVYDSFHTHHYSTVGSITVGANGPWPGR
jgi:hypothetical protein